MAKRVKKIASRTSSQRAVTEDGFWAWYESKSRRLLIVAGFLIVVAVAGTLFWQKTTIAEKFSDEYFREDALSPEDDEDNDDLNTDQETEYGTDPANRDTDGDGLTDGEEVHSYKTDPNETDTDSDGYPDQMEIYSGHDPNRATTDTQGVADSDERLARYKEAGVDSIDSLLNGNDEMVDVSLQDFGVGDLNDLASLYGTGNTSEKIVILDSDLKIIETPEDQAKPLMDKYVNDVVMAALEIFGGDTKKAAKTVSDFKMGMTGQFELLNGPIKNSATFTDRLLEIEVPQPAVELHKQFLETLMLSESLMRGLQRLGSESMEPMALLAKMNRIEEVGLEAERELDLLSDQYELGLTSDFFSAAPALDSLVNGSK